MEEVKDPASGDGSGIFWNIQDKSLTSVCLQTATATINPNTKKIEYVDRYPKEYAGTVHVAKTPGDIEKLITHLEAIRDKGQPLGLILEPSKVSMDVNKITGDDENVIGKGLFSKIVIVKDKKFGGCSAKKTIMLAQFDGDQIRSWIYLGQAGTAPKLYCFKQNGNKVEMLMEIIEGKTLQDVLESKFLKNSEHAISLSVCALDGLLSAFETLREGKFTHGDMHAGNVMVDSKINIKLFDFDMARRFLQDEAKDSQRIKNDLIEIIRIFCALYSGYDLDSRYDAEKILKAKNLNMLSSIIRQDLNESQCQELFKILTMLIDCVSDPRQENFGDTSHVSQYLRNNFSIVSMKKQLAVILFPERFQKADSPDSCEMECEMELSSVWDDPELAEFEKRVTDEDLKQLGVILLA